MKHAFKKTLAMLLVLVMVIGLIPSVFAAKVAPFTDVDESDWFAPYVKYVYEHEPQLMNGTAADRFEPEGYCTRAMAAVVIYRLADPVIPSVKPSSFVDLTEDWYKNGIAWAEDHGVVNGVGDNRFDPDGLVTREQLVTMLWRYAGEPKVTENYLKDFPDADKIASYAKDAFNWAISMKIIGGSDGKLLPRDNATRAEFAKIITVFAKATAPCEHVWDEGKVTKEPTCTEKGEKVLTCKLCGATKTVEIPAKGHTWDEGKVTTEPTCTEKGVKTFTCTVCGETKAEEIAALGHIDENNDGICDRCGENLGTEPVEGKVVIYYPKDGKVMTTESYTYTNSSSGKTKDELAGADATVTDGKVVTDATNAAEFEVITVDGVTTFKTADGKYLYADGTNVRLVDTEDDNTKFVIEEATDGVYLRCANATYQGNAQYIEVYGGYFTVFGFASDKADIYTFQLLPLSTATPDPDPDPDPEPIPVPEGYAAIYNPANGVVMTTEVSVYTGSSGTKDQLKPASATLADGKLTTTAENVALFKIETVDGVTTFKTEDGKYLYADGTNVRLVDTESEYTNFVLENATDGCFIKCETAQYNGNAQYIEYYASKEVFSVFGMGNDTTLYTFAFYEIDKGETPDPEPSYISVPSTTRDGATIPTYVTLPETYDKTKTYPLVVMLHGHGGNHNEWGGYDTISNTLAAKGFVVVTLDFPGCGASTEDFTLNTMTNMKADVLDVINYVVDNYAVDETKIGGFGYSMGGRILLEMTAENMFSFTTLELVAPAEDTEDLKDLFGGAEKWEELKAKANENGYADFTTQYGQQQKLSKEWFADLEKYTNGDIVEQAAAKYEGNTLVIWATNDEAVRPAISAHVADVLNAATVNTYADGHSYSFYGSTPYTVSTVNNACVNYFVSELQTEKTGLNGYVRSITDDGKLVLTVKAADIEGLKNGDTLTFTLGGKTFVTVYGNTEGETLVTVAESGNLVLSLPEADLVTTNGFATKTVNETTDATEWYYADGTVIPMAVSAEVNPYIPPVENYGLAAELKDGDKVIIYNAGRGKAIKNETDRDWYLLAEPVTPADGTISTADTTIVWTATKNEDGTFTFTNGENAITAWLSVNDKGSFVELTNDATHEGADTKWNVAVCNAENHTYFISSSSISTDKGPGYIECYPKSGVDKITGYATKTPAEGDYSFQFYVLGAEPAHVHTWNDGEVTKEATCTEKGVKTFTCTKCGETKTEEIAALGHIDENEDGKCDRCGINMAPAPKLVETALTDIKATDKVVIVFNAGEKAYAALNNGGTTTKGAVKEFDGESHDETMYWNVVAVTNDEGAVIGYTFYVNGSTEDFLYTIADNNGIRVGKSTTGGVWSVDTKSGYLTAKDSKGATRYLGIYLTGPNLRAYTSVHSNIKDQSYTFYVVTEP